jgi:hypothetical protein
MGSEVWAALLGALVGSIAGGVATWLTTRGQWRRERLGRHEDRVTDLVLETERLLRQDLVAGTHDVRPPRGHVESALTMVIALTSRTHPSFSEQLLKAKTWDPNSLDVDAPLDFFEYVGQQLEVLHAWVRDPAAFRVRGRAGR